MMTIIEEATTLVSRDGTPLAASLLRPDDDVRAAVVICPATAVPSTYYRAFATFLAARGFAVVTFDYRGLFGSKLDAAGAERARVRDWGEQDIAAAIAWAKARFPTQKLLAVTHSIGGQVLPLAPNRGAVDAIYMVASQGGYFRTWASPVQVVGMWVVWNAIMPTLVAGYGYWPGHLGVGADLPKGVALEWGKWCRSPDYLFVDDGPARRAAFASMRVPIHAESFTDDTYASPKAVKWLLDQYAGATVTQQHRRPSQLRRGFVGHFGFFRDRFRDSLWEEAAVWLGDRTRPIDKPDTMLTERVASLGA